MSIDYTPEAVSRRLRQVDDLRRTCLALAARPGIAVRETPVHYKTSVSKQAPNIAGHPDSGQHQPDGSYCPP